MRLEKDLTDSSVRTESSGRPRGSRQQVKLALVPHAQDADLGTVWHESVEREVARLSERDHELPDVSVTNAADQRVLGKERHCAADGRRRAKGGGRIFAREKPEQTLQIVQGPSRIDYRRHGFGRTVFLPPATRSSQA